MTLNYSAEPQPNGSAVASAEGVNGVNGDAWRCATCGGEWTIGVLLLGGRFHPTCEPRPSESVDARETWEE